MLAGDVGGEFRDRVRLQIDAVRMMRPPGCIFGSAWRVTRKMPLTLMSMMLMEGLLDLRVRVSQGGDTLEPGIVDEDVETID